MWISEKTWHALTHSVFQLAGAVRELSATQKRMESRMSEQGDQLRAVVDTLVETANGLHAEIQDLKGKVASAAAAGTPVDPAIADQIARLVGLSGKLQSDLPAVATATDAVVPSTGTEAGATG